MMIKNLLILSLSFFLISPVFSATELDYMEYATDGAAQAAYVTDGDSELPSGDLLDEDCSDISDWADDDLRGAVSEVSPAGQFRFDSNTGAATNDRASRSIDVGDLPNTSTYEIKLYHDSIGTQSNNDYFQINGAQVDEQWWIRFASDGLYFYDTDSDWTELGTNLVKQDEWQTWRFLFTFTGTTGDGTCDVYLNDSTHTWEKVGTSVACSREFAGTEGLIQLYQFGYTTNDMVSHVDYVKLDSGLTTPTSTLQSYSEDTIKTQGTYSLKGVAIITDSLNDTLTRTVDPTIDLTGLSSWEFDIYSSRTGANIKVGIHDSGGTTTETTYTVLSADTWEPVTVSISGVSNANKDAIDSIIITPVNADAANTFYIDDMYAESARRIIMVQ